MFEKRRLRRGLTALQAVLTVASAATALSVSTLPLHRALRQARLHGAVRGVYSVVVTARMEAIRRSQPVVVSADSSRRRVVCWADEGPYNFLQDSDEPALAAYDIPRFVSLRSRAGETLIVFRPAAAAAPLEAAAVSQALRPSTYTAAVPAGSVDCASGCGGLFLADRAGGNVFRLSVDDFGRSGRVSLLKWLPSVQGGNRGEADFVPPPWRWVN